MAARSEEDRILESLDYHYGEEMRARRNATIEECARVAEQWGYSDVVLAIRALKSDTGR